MKKYIIDRLVLLAWGIWAMIYTPYRAGPIFTIIGEMMAIFIIVVFCHRILLLPLDLIVGKNRPWYILASTTGEREEKRLHVSSLQNGSSTTVAINRYACWYLMRCQRAKYWI